MHLGHDKQRLRRIPGTQDQLLPPFTSRKQSLLPRLPQHTTGSVQAGSWQHNMGVQAHDAERGRHGPADPPEAPAERGAARAGGS